MRIRSAKYYFVACVPLLVIALMYTAYKVNKYSQLIETKGTIISIGQFKTPDHRSTGDSYHSFPVIRYYINDKEYFHIKESELLFEDYAVNEEVNLIYHYMDPEEVYINSFYGFWATIPGIVIFFVFSTFWIGFISILDDSSLI